MCRAAVKPCLHSSLTVQDYAQSNSQRIVSLGTLGSVGFTAFVCYSQTPTQQGLFQAGIT